MYYVIDYKHFSKGLYNEFETRSRVTPVSAFFCTLQYQEKIFDKKILIRVCVWINVIGKSALQSRMSTSQHFCSLKPLIVNATDGSGHFFVEATIHFISEKDIPSWD